MTVIALCFWSTLMGTWATAQTSVERFNGSGPDSTSSFRVDGPWLLNWGVSSDFPTVAHLEIHLYDAQTGRFVGLALRHTGIGSGQRLIRESGEYRIVVVGRSIDWRIEIEEAPENLAALLRENPDLTEIQLVSPAVGLTREVVERISGWSSADGRLLLLETDYGTKISAGFIGDAVCPGLEDARNIFFVTSDQRGMLFNAILLEDGTRCFLSGLARLN